MDSCLRRNDGGGLPRSATEPPYSGCAARTAAMMFASDSCSTASPLTKIVGAPESPNERPSLYNVRVRKRSVMSHRLIVRFCPADDGPATVGVEVLGAALTAINAAIAAICQASDGERSPILTSVEFADPVMHLSFDGANATPIERLVADLSAGGGPLPHQSASSIRELQYALPKGVPTVELTYGGCTARVPGVRHGEGDAIWDDGFSALLKHRPGAGKPFVWPTDDELLSNVDVEAFNRMVVEGRGRSE